MAEETKNTSTETTETTVTTNAETTPTVEELQAQLAKVTADAERYKSANDKSSKEAADYKRQLRAKQSEDERLAEEQKEAQRIREEEFEAVKAENNRMKATNAYRAIKDEKTVEKLIDAVSDADHNAIATIISNECKKAVAEAEAQWLKDRPPVSSGVYSNMSQKEIMAISDRKERRKAIAQNQNLF